MWWSREAPPCHIAVVGLRHPSPGTVRTPLRVYGSVTARSDKTHFLWIILRWQSLHTTSVFLCLAIIAISHRSFAFEIFEFVNVVNLVMIALCRSTQLTDLCFQPVFKGIDCVSVDNGALLM